MVVVNEKERPSFYSVWAYSFFPPPGEVLEWCARGRTYEPPAHPQPPSPGSQLSTCSTGSTGGMTATAFIAVCAQMQIRSEDVFECVVELYGGSWVASHAPKVAQEVGLEIGGRRGAPLLGKTALL